MSDQQLRMEREQAMHLLRSGLSVSEISQSMGRSPVWVYKWKKRYEAQGWAGLVSQSREPNHARHEYDEEMRRLICQTRSELEAEAASGIGLCYIGATTIQARLRERLKPSQSLPSMATINRVLNEAGMTRAKEEALVKIAYPTLCPTQPHQVHQVDIVPHHLPGGPAVACFNALDTVSRYPTGQARMSKTSQDAARFLLHLWRELGIATYTQMDNEGCFSGGATHPYVLGRVLRLCLLVGTQAVFIPIRHPKSNAAIERFHQDYNQHVWQRHYLDDMTTLNFHADLFFDTYRTTHYPAALNGQTPQQVHAACPQHPLPTHFAPTLDKLPITEGQVHFIRKVQSDGTISILNLPWQVPAAAQQGVWATLSLSTTQSEGVLAVFDDAPTALSRAPLITHSFPLPDSVVPLRAEFRSVPITAMLPIWPRPLARLAQKVLTMF